MIPVNPPPLDRTSPPWTTDAGPSPASALPEGVRARLRRLVYEDQRAAAELVPRLTERQAAGADPLPVEPAELAPRLLGTLRREIRALPDDTRLLLLLAAADQYPVTTHAFLRAVTAVRVDTRPLEAAETAGIAHAGAGGVSFRDAWTRIAAYETASPADRRAAHQLLARVLGGKAETTHRSWHRGAAALGPSARLAAELRLAADRARAEGRPALARALAERAAELSPDPVAEAGLLAAAAADAWRSGEPDRARRLAARTDNPALGGVLALRAGNAAEAFDALLTAAVRQERSVDAAALLALATEAAVYTGDLGRCREAQAVAHWLGLAPSGVLAGLAAAFEGRYDEARVLLKGTAGRCGPGGAPGPLIHSGIAALLLGDPTRAVAATLRAAASARARGTPGTVVQAMEFRVYADFWTGRTRSAEAAAQEALTLAHATGQDNGACHLRAALAMFAAVTGDEEACRERAAAVRSYALAHGLGLAAALAQWALAFLDLTHGRFPAAAARLRALAGFGPGHGHRAIRHLATPHYVEAAVRTGDTRVARTAHADYHRWATAVRSPDDLALSARCRALLAPGAEAVPHYRAALDLHARGTRDFERARTELLFAGALRRTRQRAEARDRLHSALEAFESFGAPHCAAQARAELRALGAPLASHPGVDPAAVLTAQQLTVARMAAEGATNREIGDRLNLSPRTIDHHLRGVFARLGIRSRIELVRLLGESS
ncbi:LuxR C-terminal-related transcriptional regulator [Streptomyces sp. NPDC006655]|uniref:LuxR C-terminal-related transcriptional regulator n=1 Tax=Streptomyces sp. NPDC006655 TaxID=3156898 RepID=UPI003454F065